MATDFPNSPANGATHTFGGTTYTYSTSVGAWTAGSSAGGASVTVSETAPSSPAEGDLWFDPSVLKTFVYYNDGTANQWVQSNPTGSGGGGASVTVSETAPSSPAEGDLWFDPSVLKTFVYYNDGTANQWVQNNPTGSGGGGASVTASDTAPSSPSAGDLWYKSDTNALYVYYNDGDSSQWVGVSGPAGASATGFGQVPIVYTEPSTTHSLNSDGSTSTIQMQAVDPEGTSITYAIAYANATNARPNQLAADTAINQSTGTFTFDPSTNSSHAGTFKARLSASDGITHATRFVDISLSFITWTTSAGSLGTLNWSNRAASALTTSTVVASGATSYAIQSGSLPAGLSLASNGVISGTATAQASDTTSNFTIRATGGSATTDRAFTIEVKAPVQTVFNSSSTWSVPAGVISPTVLVVAGGGAGGVNGTSRGTGGGAGGLIYIPSWDCTGASSYSVTVGAGGTNNNGTHTTASNWTSGSNSVITGGSKTLTALGGGRGGAHDSTNNNEGGGSSGGAWYGFSGASNPRAATQPANTLDGVNTYNSSGFGNAGGTGSNGAPYGSGGGGAGAAGQNFNAGQDGGTGKDYSTEFGTSVGTTGWFASGGASAGYQGGLQVNSTSSTGGGGDGINNTTTIPASCHGAANTGGGGGSGGAGGSGIVIIKY